MTPYYDRDGITIYHAKCETILPSVDPSTVSLLIADPPYGINLATKSKKHRDRRASSLDWPKIDGDRESFDPMLLLNFPRLVLFGANNYADRLPQSKGWLVWDKRAGLEPNDNGDCELAWTNITGAVRRFAHRWDGVIRESESGEHHLHPTQKPVALFRWIIERWTKPGDLILDPYMGSGPIAEACRDHGRRYIGIELKEDYCQKAVIRLQQSVLPFERIAS